MSEKLDKRALAAQQGASDAESTSPPGSLEAMVYNAAGLVHRPDGTHARTSVERSQERLVRARALKELTLIHEAREALAAATDGLTQRQIAGLLGTSQSEIHRMLRRARAGELVEPLVSVREVVLQRVAGMITSGMMRGTLTAMTRGESAPGEQVDGYRPGTWDAVRAAYMDGLLSEADYEELRLKVRIDEWQSPATG